jgi:hypothetical protein
MPSDSAGWKQEASGDLSTGPGCYDAKGGKKKKLVQANGAEPSKGVDHSIGPHCTCTRVFVVWILAHRTRVPIHS